MQVKCHRCHKTFTPMNGVERLCDACLGLQANLDISVPIQESPQKLYSDEPLPVKQLKEEAHHIHVNVHIARVSSLQIVVIKSAAAMNAIKITMLKRP